MPLTTLVLLLSRHTPRPTFMDRLPISSARLPVQVSVEFSRVRIGLINAEGRKLALKIIGALLRLPAASALLSENGVSSLSDEILLLYGSLSSNQTNFKHTVRLMKDVVARVEDIIIWTIVIDLVVRVRPILHPTTPQESVPRLRPTNRHPRPSTQAIS